MSHQYHKEAISSQETGITLETLIVKTIPGCHHGRHALKTLVSPGIPPSLKTLIYITRDTGITGDTEDTGITRDTAITGDTVDTGITKDTANTRDTGDNGNTGDTAITGYTANTGITGDTAITGNTGDTAI